MRMHVHDKHVCIIVFLFDICSILTIHVCALHKYNITCGDSCLHMKMCISIHDKRMETWDVSKCILKFVCLSVCGVSFYITSMRGRCMHNEQVVDACRTCITLVAAERKHAHVLCSRIEGQYTGQGVCEQKDMKDKANSSTLRRRHTASAWLRKSTGSDHILQNKNGSTCAADGKEHESTYTRRAHAPNLGTMTSRPRKDAARLATPRFLRKHVSKEIRAPVFQQ
jgi:hypothetical protein